MWIVVVHADSFDLLIDQQRYFSVLNQFHSYFCKSWKSNLLFSLEKGFLSSSPVNNGTIQVRAGESLPLRVSMEAYPKPHTITWSFMGRGLHNTTDHVITTHSHEYT